MQSLLFDKNPNLIYVPPSTFLTFSTASSFTHLASLFHLTTTYRIRISGVFPVAQPTCFINNPYLLVVSDFLLPKTEVFGARSIPLRLQGFLSEQRSVEFTECLALSKTRSPLTLSIPSGFSSDTLKKPSLFLRS